ncbi:hypothetical protein HanHA300_Chr01g0034261 [Helianthus annuus]|nr:hypothetical protein HanHA300_Chr01g0034261 [Helianthus annuus]KAJ0628469.1 hypothetical protein HanHA89_Chr01g0036921 [Helianthus annuus]KAJ0815660.1 hypothetical protein HanLR1_Chr00c0674g0767141 [Helianthus annuus]
MVLTVDFQKTKPASFLSRVEGNPFLNHTRLGSKMVQSGSTRLLVTLLYNFIK